jgi:hypothetical protein
MGHAHDTALETTNQPVLLNLMGHHFYITGGYCTAQ